MDTLTTLRLVSARWTAIFAGTSAFLFSTLLGTSCPHAVWAGTISYAGEMTDLGANWRLPSTVKSLDVDGNNVLGSDGWYLFAGSNTSSLTPQYVSSMVRTTSTYPGNSSYASVNNPLNTPGPSPTNIISGTANPTPGLNLAAPILTITLSGSVPSHIRIGVMIDNLNASTFNPSSIRVYQTNGTGDSGVQAVSSSSFNNMIPDWLFFDLLGASANEQYQILAYGGGSGIATVAAVSFDSLQASTSANTTTEFLFMSAIVP